MDIKQLLNLLNQNGYSNAANFLEDIANQNGFKKQNITQKQTSTNKKKPSKPTKQSKDAAKSKRKTPTGGLKPKKPKPSKKGLQSRTTKSKLKLTKPQLAYYKELRANGIRITKRQARLDYNALKAAKRKSKRDWMYATRRIKSLPKYKKRIKEVKLYNISVKPSDWDQMCSVLKIAASSAAKAGEEEIWIAFVRQLDGYTQQLNPTQKELVMMHRRTQELIDILIYDSSSARKNDAAEELDDIIKHAALNIALGNEPKQTQINFEEIAEEDLPF